MAGLAVLAGMQSAGRWRKYSQITRDRLRHESAVIGLLADPLLDEGSRSASI